ncbi:histidine kinase [Mycobacterium sp. CBMA293]|uniref:histidine kinase n=1 Tax=unclassified Mycolicibacterium TaxID=2636767 RepID=UPI0012DD5E74|nr:MULTISPECIES: histidine kinase [unclassified Mycolicibacterium]MUL44972.1 histidine kinase [Mycolicibacterium sp. CBMA 360]MUL57919.1 histidine kinase [Mycolicibacterium sp. CBMA 335]MUL72632.1 histidine kinase [Mycolicibacterium sp. CBMA 311]MUL95565.1 histidine kinase [Mycolicibacterium sp. CBMA 230]MUM07350.1 histidine kinase [Mycolicibacterium sp. CBMA 213]
MDLQPYVDGVRLELEIAAAAGGAEATELAERLSAPLDSALRLALLEALSEAAEHITRELAPGSVEVRLRGRDPEFVVAGVPADADRNPRVDADADLADGAFAAPAGDDGGTWRVTLRLPEGLRGGVDAAARRDGQSVNAWLVRAVGAALGGPSPRDRKRGNTVTGWVR